MLSGVTGSDVSGSCVIDSWGAAERGSPEDKDVLTLGDAGVGPADDPFVLHPAVVMVAISAITAHDLAFMIPRANARPADGAV